MDDHCDFILLNDTDDEPWAVKCQPYPRKWLNEKRRSEKWQSKPHLKQVAADMARQDIRGREKYRLAIWAGYLQREAQYVARLVKTGGYLK